MPGVGGAGLGGSCRWAELWTGPGISLSPTQQFHVDCSGTTCEGEGGLLRQSTSDKQQHCTAVPAQYPVCIADTKHTSTTTCKQQFVFTKAPCGHTGQQLTLFCPFLLLGHPPPDEGEFAHVQRAPAKE